MASQSNVTIDVLLEDSGAPQEMEREVREGLASKPRRLPSKYFYDEHGSRLFERITRLPEYYLTRAERALLERFSGQIATISGLEELVELGAGAAEKTRWLIEAGRAAGALRRFLPVEVSQEIAERSSREIAARFPGLEVHAVVADFESHLEEVPHGGTRLVALLGSTIGNFPEDEAVALLEKIEKLMDHRDWLLLGLDLVKDRERLEAAYNDSQGVTAEFNTNILSVINEHLAGDFDPARFEHVSCYNAEEQRIETYLRSTAKQAVRLETLDLDVTFERDELLWTEVSCKYTRESAGRILARAGLELEHWFTDEDETFALALARMA